MTFININNLHIQYDNHVVLQKFSKEFGKGVHWIKGHNGSGKSSLLKSICGINPISESMVNIMGEDLAMHPLSAKSSICYVQDKPEVYPFMSGIQFLKFIAKIKKAELTDDLYKWLESINLNTFMDTPFSKMSFGTRRKFTLSSIFIGNPAIVLLDEPFNGLDNNSVQNFSQWLQQAKSEKCILAVSHEPHVIEDIYDSITDLSDTVSSCD